LDSRHTSKEAALGMGATNVAFDDVEVTVEAIAAAVQIPPEMPMEIWHIWTRNLEIARGGDVILTPRNLQRCLLMKILQPEGERGRRLRC
jgi:hypothetical protein